MYRDRFHLSVNSYGKLAWMDLVIETEAQKGAKRGIHFSRASHPILNRQVLSLRSRPHLRLQRQQQQQLHQILGQRGEDPGLVDRQTSLIVTNRFPPILILTMTMSHWI
jgi:hypothetical protein